MLGGILAKLLTGPVLSGLVNTIAGPLLELYKAHTQGKISMEQLKVEMGKIISEGVVQVEKAHSDALTQTYGTFMGAVKESKALQAMLIAVVLSQLFVLVWYQWAVPFLIFFFYPGMKYPSAGSTIDWTYLLIAGLCGLGPVALRYGPAGMQNVSSAFKGLIK